MLDDDFDVLIIGGGIAGAALASRIAAVRRVGVLEMEEQPGYHSTGRSAAVYVEGYGNPVIRSLTRASREFFFSPPSQFTEERLVAPRQVLIFGRTDRREAFEAFLDQHLPSPHLELVDAQTAVALCPVLRSDGLLGAVVDNGAADVEVHTLHQAYLRQFNRRGGRVLLQSRVEAITYAADGRWVLTTPQGSCRAKVIVNAAGAWADEVARMAGARPVGIEPRRRTAALIEPPEGVSAESWPMIVDADETFYMKPDAGLLLISPADETLSTPADAQPEDLDIAIAADRAETFTTLKVNRIKGKWAGLRTFVSDRSPVVGFDDASPGFFWMAALGGYGIQTAPALSALAAKLLLETLTARDLGTFDFNLADISPARCASGSSAKTAALPRLAAGQ